MNPYTKKYLDFLESNDDENLKFTDVHSMPLFCYEVWSMEEISKRDVKRKMKILLDNNKLQNTKWHNQQILHNEVMKMELEEKERKKPFWFITISPKPDAVFEQFKSNIEDISTFIWCEKCFWTFEQRGTCEEDMGEGFHAHIILDKYNISPSKLKTIIKNKFEKFVVVDKYIDNKINILEKAREYLLDKMEYITGKKIDEDKPQKVEMDKKWREKLGLKLFYSFDILTDERRISTSLGGRREGSGVKKGTKRGKYKSEVKTKKNDNENKIKEIEIVKKKQTLTF